MSQGGTVTAGGGSLLPEGFTATDGSELRKCWIALGQRAYDAFGWRRFAVGMCVFRPHDPSETMTVVALTDRRIWATPVGTLTPAEIYHDDFGCDDGPPVIADVRDVCTLARFREEVDRRMKCRTFTEEDGAKVYVCGGAEGKAIGTGTDHAEAWVSALESTLSTLPGSER